MAFDKVERVEPETTTVVGVTLDRKNPDYLGSFADDEIPAEGSDLRNLFNAWQGAKLVLSDWKEHCRLIDVNPHLTTEGKLAAKQAALAPFDERVSHLMKVVEIHEDGVRKVEKELSGAQLFKTDDAAGAVRMAEIRSWFAKVDRAQQISMLHEAINAGDEENLELVAAVVNAPAAMKLIPTEIRKALVDAVAEKRYPDKVADLNRRRKVAETARFGLTRASELLRAGFPETMRARLQGVK